jgi:hypothetical protein
MLTLRGHRGHPNNKPRSEVADVNLFLPKKRPDQDERYRVCSTEAPTTAIDQTAGLVILTTEPCRFVFRPGPSNEEARLPLPFLALLANHRALISGL